MSFAPFAGITQIRSCGRSSLVGASQPGRDPSSRCFAVLNPLYAGGRPLSRRRVSPPRVPGRAAQLQPVGLRPGKAPLADDQLHVRPGGAKAVDLAEGALLQAEGSVGLILSVASALRNVDGRLTWYVKPSEGETPPAP